MISLRIFKHSRSIFAILISLGLLLSACNLPTAGANPVGDTPTPALLSTLMASGVTLTVTTTLTSAHTATPAPALAVTTSTRAPAGTAASQAPAPTALLNGSISPAELAQFPATLRTLDLSAPAAVPCDHLMTQQPSGAAGEPVKGPVLRGLALCIWGISLDEPVQLTFISPDGAQRLSGTFRLVQQPDNTYKVVWPGAEKFNTGSATALEGGMNYINLSLWWPGGLAPGEWRIEASGGGQSASGRLVIPAPTQAWSSLESDGATLQPLDGCHILLPAPTAERPLSAVGAGYAPGTTLLGLYRRSLDKPSDALVREAVMNAPVGTGGTFRVSFWLSRLSKDGPGGEFWIVPLTSASRAFMQTGDRASVQNVVDCFVMP